MSVPAGLNAACMSRRLLAYDPFSDANGTNIIGKALPLSGGAWAAARASGADVLSTTGGVAVLAGAGAVKAVCTETSISDVVISGDLKAFTSTDVVQLLGKWNGTLYNANTAGSWIAGYIRADGFTVIFQMLNGVGSNLATVTVASNANVVRSCSLIVQETAVTFITPTTTLTATMNAALVGNTKHGFQINNNASTTNTFDNFKVEAL